MSTTLTEKLAYDLTSDEVNADNYGEKDRAKTRTLSPLSAPHFDPPSHDDRKIETDPSP